MTFSLEYTCHTVFISNKSIEDQPKEKTRMAKIIFNTFFSGQWPFYIWNDGEISIDCHGGEGENGRTDNKHESKR